MTRFAPRWPPRLAALAAAPAGAYEHLGQTVGSQVLPQHWRTLPIALTVDNGPTNVLAEISTAIATWNAVPTAKDPWGTATLASAGLHQGQLRDRVGQPQRRRPAGGRVRRGRQHPHGARPRPGVGQRVGARAAA